MMTSWCPAKCREDEALRIFQTALSYFVIFCNGEGGVGWISKWKSSTSISTNLRRSGAVWEWRWTHCLALLSKSYARMTRPTSCATVAMDISYAVNVKSYEVIMLGFMFYVYWSLYWFDSVIVLRASSQHGACRSRLQPWLSWTILMQNWPRGARWKNQAERWAAALMFAKPPDLIWLDERLSLMSEKQETSHSVLRSLLSLLHSNRRAC